MATPLSGLCLFLPLALLAGLAVGEMTDSGCLQGLATVMVGGEEIEDGTGGVWGGT